MDLRREGGRRSTSRTCDVKFGMPLRHQSEDARERTREGGWTRRGVGPRAPRMGWFRSAEGQFFCGNRRDKGEGGHRYSEGNRNGFSLWASSDTRKGHQLTFEDSKKRQNSGGKWGEV